MKKVSIGGQALIEGIMMKSPEKTAIAVREPSGNIGIEYIEEKHIKDKIPFLGWPMLRGVVNFIESMLLGYKSLMISADKSGMTQLEDEQECQRKIQKLAKKRDKLIKKGKLPPEAADEEIVLPEGNKKAEAFLLSVIMVIGSVLGVALAVGLFFFLPTGIFNGINYLAGGRIDQFYRPFIEGALKIAIFVSYIALTSLTKDIKRVFMYHGAEHKTIFCLENELELTVENVKKQSRFHPRCGTSFMILMLLVGIFIYEILLTVFPTLDDIALVWGLIKILMMPFICGLGYELIKFCGKHNNFITRIISAPGMWVQRITTKEPTDDMIEVAIESIKAVLPNDSTQLEADGCCPDLQ